MTEYINTVNSVLHRWYVSVAEFSPKFIVGCIVFLFFYYTSTFFSNLIFKVLNKSSTKFKSIESIKIAIGFIRFLFILAGAFIAFEIMGLNSFVMKFLGSLGVAGIIAGVALKDIVTSMFSGLLVSFDHSFKVGDNVQINGITGTVLDIGFLTTKVIAEDGKKFYIPNQLIFNAPFVNLTESSQRKVILSIEVPNTENLELIKSIIMEEISNLDGVDQQKEKLVVVVKQNVGIYLLNVKFWIKEGSNIAKVQTEGYIAIKKRLDKEEIQLATPTSSPEISEDSV